MKNERQEGNINQHTTRTSGSKGCSHFQKLQSSIFPEENEEQKDMRFSHKIQIAIPLPKNPNVGNNS